MPSDGFVDSPLPLYVYPRLEFLPLALWFLSYHLFPFRSSPRSPWRGKVHKGGHLVLSIPEGIGAAEMELERLQKRLNELESKAAAGFHFRPHHYLNSTLFLASLPPLPASSSLPHHPCMLLSSPPPPVPPRPSAHTHAPSLYLSDTPSPQALICYAPAFHLISGIDGWWLGN